MQSWSIIIFCFNEEGNVKSVIQKCISVLEKLAPNNWELIIVDDGSTDNSIIEIEDEILLLNNSNIKLIKHKINKGIGMALRSGYDCATNENVCAVPADGQFDVFELLPFAILQENTFVSFYRKENLSYSFFRNILSLLNKRINKILLGINLKDVNWVKIYKSKALKNINPQLKSSLIETEICAKLILKKNNVIEIESKYNPRVNGVSKGASWKIVKKAIFELLKVYKIVSDFKKN